MTQAVFGDRDRARRWLTKPAERFNGQAPTAVVYSSQGM
ncbi:TPA: DUF2384 domain-containing protein [Escherichia coli]|nr:DUF2384 domain-containing protein [Escherichia coli]